MPLSDYLLPPILTILILTLSIPLKLLHFTVTSLLKPIFKPKYRECLTPYDAIFAVDDPEHPNASNSTILYLDGSVELKTFKDKFSELLKNELKKLTEIYVPFLCYYFWTDSALFHIDNHVREEFVEDLNSFLSRNSVRPFEIGRPMWDVTLVRGSVSCLVIRIHHTYADGYSQNYIVDLLLGKKSDYLVKRKEFGFVEQAKLLLKAPQMITKLYKEALAAEPNLFTQRKQAKTGLLSIKTLDLNKYKEIRRKTSTHFASIGMSLMIGALKRLLKTLPPDVSIMHSLPKPNHPLTKLVNHWGVGLFRVETELNPLERLFKTEKYFKNYTEERYDDLLHGIMPLIGWFPNFLLKSFFNLNFGTGMGFTSVPGWSGGEGELFGQCKVVKLAKVFGFQWGETAVASAVYTYNSLLCFTMYCNRDIVSGEEGMEQLMECLEDEFEELYKMVGTWGRRRKVEGG